MRTLAAWNLALGKLFDCDAKADRYGLAASSETGAMPAVRGPESLAAQC